MRRVKKVVEQFDDIVEVKEFGRVGIGQAQQYRYGVGFRIILPVRVTL